MTSPASVVLKAAAAIIEAIDADDAKDAELALRLIRALVADAPKS